MDDQKMTIFKPSWKFSFAFSPDIHGNLLLSYTPGQVEHTITQLGVDAALIGQVGQVGAVWVFDLDQDITDEMDKQLVALLKKRIGVDPLPFAKVQESLASGEIPTFLMPGHGCFGYIDGHLIIGQRHHQEIMFRLLEIGWTWEQLMNAPQVWGWFSKTSETEWNCWFSSDAGLMTGENLKNEVLLKLSTMVGAPVKNTGGYGGKAKKNFGGNFASKYGDPKKQSTDEMMGNKAKFKNTVLSPLPPPPDGEAKVLVQEAESLTIGEAEKKALSALLPPPKKLVNA